VLCNTLCLHRCRVALLQRRYFWRRSKWSLPSGRAGYANVKRIFNQPFDTLMQISARKSSPNLTRET
jgi:hypothetical protein